MKFELPPVNEYAEEIDALVWELQKNRAAGRELALSGLIYQFMLENNCKASECELVETNKNTGLVFETSWSVRRKTIDFQI